MTDDLKKQVESMIKKAGESDKSDDALKFSQAACNAANAMCSLVTAENMKGGK
jgi:hypothetical protein